VDFLLLEINMRNLFLFLVLAASSLFCLPSLAQESGTSSSQQDGAAPPAMQQPSTPTMGGQPAPVAQPTIVCEYQSHEGQVIPLRQCVSRHEADFRRRQQQRLIMQMQQRSLTISGE
jgi:hypothetical protein